MRADVEQWSFASRVAAAILSRPGLVLRLTGSDGPVERGGRVLHRGVQALIQAADALARATGADRADDPLGTRDEFRRQTRLAMPVRTDVHVAGRRIPGPEGAPEIPVRVYRRFGVGVGRGPGDAAPSAIVFLHGGGWVVGDLDSHDASCRLLAAVTGCVVVAVDYRLAPEHPFPAAVEDALAAYAWVQRSHDELGTAPGQVGVMGDSAGGNLAAVVALETRPGRPAHAPDVPPPVAQGLVYPAVDARLDSPSMDELAEGFFLTRAGMEAYRALYLPDPADWTDLRASPLLAPDHAGVAPAVIVTAGFDPLRDDGRRYAEALRAAGVEVDLRCYDDQIHGFFGMGIIPECLALAIETCDAMGRLMARAAAG
jgi:acetyl esterase